MLLGLAACGESAAEEEAGNDISVSDALSGETLTAGTAADGPSYPAARRAPAGSAFLK